MERFSDRLLSLLRERPHSAGELAERLGLSRELLDRALGALRARGHSVEEEPDATYLLIEPLTEAALRAALSPQRRFGAVLEVHPVVDSTNDLARALAEAGAPEGTVVIADQQTTGRGRLGRLWFSPPKRNLHLSVVLRPPLSPPQAPILTFAAAVALGQAIREKTGVQVQLKWPNDLLVSGRKLAGILTEMSALGREVSWVVVGIGVNVNLEARHLPGELVETATSLKIATGQAHSRAELGAAILQSFERWCARLYVEGPDAVLDAWRQQSATLGRRVRIREAGETIEGIAVGLEGTGALLVETAPGTTVRVLTGDVEHR
jgi:BirA family biotin operon repressor/biotin-[acetyl-CoA-carboxylase] ligase